MPKKKQRTRRLNDCSTSFPEQAILFFCRQRDSNALNRKKFRIKGKRIEADIYIPSLNTIIEYNGEFFHRDRKEQDKAKEQAFLFAGYTFIKIEEVSSGENAVILNNSINYLGGRDKNWTRLDEVIDTLFSYLGWSEKQGTIEENLYAIYEQYDSELTGDLDQLHPDIAKQWHPTKNGNLIPAMFYSSSGKKVWWQCEKGHEWQAEIGSRTKENSNCGCPYCGNRAVWKGFNDLASQYPAIAEQWHPTKNGELAPEDVTIGESSKKRWWKCPKDGYEWKETVARRVSGMRCPVCSNRVIVSGVNDLETLSPEIAAEWHPTMNGNITPSEVGNGAAMSVWWQCEHGHEWQSKIHVRTIMGVNCPYCSNREVDVGFNDLATQYPEIAALWHPTLNKKSPHEVLATDHSTFWWLCPEDSCEWKASFFKRNGDVKLDCPVCSNKVVKPGINDLATTHSELANQWNYYKNENLMPNQVNAGSTQRVWWICDHGHEWEAPIRARAKDNKTGCPYCAGHKIDAGFNDLASQRPDIAAEWDWEKNQKQPDEVHVGSTSKAHWKCSKGHTWEAVIASRTQENVNCGCPYCGNRAVWIGFNDVASRYPELVEQWHPTKNGNLMPNDITIASSKRVWWKCPKDGYEWQQRVRDRTDYGILEHARRCPVCSNHVVISGVNDLKTLSPEIAKEWHPTKNGDLKPSDVANGAARKVWWQCKKGHEWKTGVHVRTETHAICPFCSGRKTWKGYNDLQSVYPELMEEWNWEKNDIDPSTVTTGTKRKAHWKCKHGIEWAASISERTLGQTACPKCHEERELPPRSKRKRRKTIDDIDDHTTA